jgi:glycosyltransferase involved in cell wall biosynthesis
MNSVILKDVSLCSIVRDEIMNPAGGIERFVESHVPYVEEAVIVDTGSVDGTREKLEELKSRHSNLKIYDIKFNGYADARNKSLGFVKTKKALILDADELLTRKKPQNDWKILKKYLKEYGDYPIFRFNFLEISPEKIFYPSPIRTLATRLINKDDVTFVHYIWEIPSELSSGRGVSVSEVEIKHFVPSEEAKHKKEENFYHKIIFNIWKSGDFPNLSPSKTKGFEEWKKFNPKRNDYI